MSTPKVSKTWQKVLVLLMINNIKTTGFYLIEIGLCFAFFLLLGKIPNELNISVGGWTGILIVIGLFIFISLIAGSFVGIKYKRKNDIFSFFLPFFLALLVYYQGRLSGDYEISFNLTAQTIWPYVYLSPIIFYSISLGLPFNVFIIIGFFFFRSLVVYFYLAARRKYRAYR